MATGLARIQQGIALLDEAKRAIARAAPIEELKQIRDQSEAIRSLAKKAGLGLEVLNLAAESKLRTERAIGDALALMKKHNGDPRSHDVTRLSDLGIEKMESHRWQKLASIPEKRFEEYIADAEEITTAEALRLAKSETRAVKRRSAENKTAVSSSLEEIEQSGTKFTCIYADPPWQYGNQGTRAATKHHYDTMTPEQVAAMPVQSLVADEALLFLWTTNGFLFESKQVIDGWGFEFKSSIVWIKPQIGIGNYVRNSHEFLLIASRGGMLTSDARKKQRSWVQVDRKGHSRKPDDFRRIVEQLSEGPRLELFGRERIEGWTVFGNQISKQGKLALNGSR